jgi:hypothetical protein
MSVYLTIRLHVAISLKMRGSNHRDNKTQKRTRLNNWLSLVLVGRKDYV